MIKTKARVAAFLLLSSLAFGANASLPIADSQGKALPSLAPMLQKVDSAVVNIATFSDKEVYNPLMNDPFFRRFFNLPQQQEQQKPKRQRREASAGSGVIVQADDGTGVIVTNYHVVKGADEIQVSLVDGRTFEAKLVGKDPQVDIAVLKIKADKLHALPISDSDKLKVGDFVVAIGNPFALGQTITTGVVSALGRSGLGIEGYENFIQTDASINPGNSGGALVNLNGQLVGINTAIIAPGGGNVGIGFAIPANMMRNVADQILANGKVTRGQIGVTIQDVTPALSKAFDLKNGQRGVLITDVLKDSPASKAGLKAGDLVVAVDGKITPNSGQLRHRIAFTKPGSSVTLTVIRDGHSKDIDVKVGKSSMDDSSGELHDLLEGVSLSESSDGRGMAITDLAPNSEAAVAGLRPNDVILSINRKPVNSMSDVEAALEKSGGQVLLQVRRGRGVFYLVLR